MSATIDMQDWWEVENYTLSISVTDGVHKDGPHNLSIQILDLRPAPEIKNLPKSISIKEDAVGGQQVFKVSHS